MKQGVNNMKHTSLQKETVHLVRHPVPSVFNSRARNAQALPQHDDYKHLQAQVY